MKVTLLDVTKDALALIYAACRQCYAADGAAEMFEKAKLDASKAEQFIAKVAASGHESPLEHAKFTFAIEGVSRALTHQLVRHRIASFSQQSQRYVKEEAFDYVIPPSIEKNAEMKKIFLQGMKEIQENYNKLLEFYKAEGKAGEQANQDARFLLPQAAETKIVVTMNCRELIHFFKHRCCTRAQWEIRDLANRMLAICRKELPAVFKHAGAKCEALGYCPEGEKFTCKRYPVKPPKS